ncbi:YlxQ family RNA-binding protein [Lederbergia lenta]|uniref:50S ribosomal protein L7Ae n=1 Tax=Lederbergia lenta TaxID=1467 RepID=A0A2X4WNC2_LEDLE|nr:YlxQ family RNA-binding protein [Lederbergia lenta]MCM3110112.1 YlxQ family RNA-binding protein [Lederbergia lenta]MEC2324319.1 YlxQ family RNA-binding protein [Lederbergia lenta]SQI60192.1 50S ribosomal protein L7Ae [Lederbergia lenta]
MKQEKWMSLLGLATRARKTISGEELVIKEIKQARAKLVIISRDASSNTLKKLQDKCNFYKVPYLFVESREQLGHAIGKEARVVVTLTDEGFAKKLASMLDE